MPRVLRFEETPNPHALKIVLDAPLPAQGAPPRGSPPRSFRSPDAAKDDPLALAVLSIPGVTGVLFGDDWLTITRHARADWSSIKPGVSRVMERA